MPLAEVDIEYLSQGKWFVHATSLRGGREWNPTGTLPEIMRQITEELVKHGPPEFAEQVEAERAAAPRAAPRVRNSTSAPLLPEPAA